MRPAATMAANSVFIHPPWWKKRLLLRRLAPAGTTAQFLRRAGGAGRLACPARTFVVHIADVAKMLAQYWIAGIRCNRIVSRYARLAGRACTVLLRGRMIRISLRLARPSPGRNQFFRAGLRCCAFAARSHLSGLEWRRTVGAGWIPTRHAGFPVADLAIGFVRRNAIDLLQAAR